MNVSPDKIDAQAVYSFDATDRPETFWIEVDMVQNPDGKFGWEGDFYFQSWWKVSVKDMCGEIAASYEFYISAGITHLKVAKMAFGVFEGE